MKKLVLLSTVVTLFVFALVTGCSRHDDHYYVYDDITFWNNQSSIGNITVTVDGTYTQYITATQRAYNCNTPGSANFYIEEGDHTYSAYSTTGQTWHGSFYLNSSCLLFELY